MGHLINRILEIAEESRLNKREKYALKIIAKEVKELETENRKLRKEPKS